jgi:hypothetical protein
MGKAALIRHQRYAHAHQFKRAGRALRKLKTYLGRTIRDIARAISGEDDLKAIFLRPLHVRHQIIWDIWRRDRLEDLAHLLSDVMRPGRDEASVGSGWSVV